MKTSKHTARQGLKHIRRSIEQVKGHWLAKHKVWISVELATFCEENGIALAPRGEGVASPATPQNANQSSPSSKISQCPLTLNGNDLAANGAEDNQHCGNDELRTTGYLSVVPLARESAVTNGSVTTTSVFPASYYQTCTFGKDERVPEFPSVAARFSAPECPESGSGAAVVSLPVVGPVEIMEPKAFIWPAETKVQVVGWCRNPRLAQGRMVDESGRLTRNVTLWQGRFRLRQGATLSCKLDMVQGDDARYLPV